MAVVSAALAAIALIGAAPVGTRVAHWRSYIDEASARFAIPAVWIERVMQAESGGKTSLNGRAITSRAGAMGLMQLMPGTWAAIRADLQLGTDPFDPHDNIVAGAAYLRAMYDRFGYPGLFAAYNSGPARYAAYLAGGRPLPTETRAYLAAIAGPAQARLPSPSHAPLFADIGIGRADPASPARGCAQSLFAIRHGVSCRDR